MNDFKMEELEIDCPKCKGVPSKPFAAPVTGMPQVGKERPGPCTNCNNGKTLNAKGRALAEFIRKVMSGYYPGI